MAKSAKPAPAPAPAAEAPAKPKSKKLLLAIIGVVILAAAGGAGWYFTKGGKHTEEAKAVVAEAPTFLALDPITVNLQHEEGDQYLNIGITLKVSSAELADKIRQNKAEVLSRLLFLLSSKHGSELIPLEGKKKLAQEIIAEINSIIGVRTGPQKNIAHETTVTSNTEAVSGVVAPATSAVEPPATVAVASAPAETTAEGHAGEATGGVIDVLYTAFIIQ